MLTQLSAARAILMTWAATVILVAVVAVCDVAFRGTHRGIMTLLVAVPALSLILLHRRRLPLLTGGIAFAVALGLGATEWRDRPIVVTGTLINIALVAFLVRRMAGSVSSRTDAVQPTDSGTALPLVSTQPQLPTVWSARAEDVQVAALALPVGGQGRLCRVSYDVRATRFGTRLLLFASPDGDARPEKTAAHLLYHWARIAGEEAGLAEVARRLDAAVSVEHDGGARCVNAVMVSIASPAAAEVICCGHRPPLFLADGNAQPLNVLAPLPSLGRFAQNRAGLLPIYTTAVRLASGRRLLLHMDASPQQKQGDGDEHTLLNALRAQAGGLDSLAPDACLDRLSVCLAERQQDDSEREFLLMAVEQAPQTVRPHAPAHEDSSGKHHVDAA